ncbi:MAG TPA: cell division protein CrgA [Ilumatobacteraceae bacterium]|nr:cell division protein CrgA [Ilumatobacteraceae bacterium]
MAPPKRKTGGGRVTPKGTRPEDRHTQSDDQPHHAAEASSRYTPKAAKRQLVPPHWIPIIMIVLLVAGGLMIMARYLVFTESNIPTLIGLGFILAGLYTATKWR